MQDTKTADWEAQFEQLWMEVLGVDSVEDHDDFFDFGGHSLSALRLSTLIRQELNLAVMFGHVLENPVFADLREIARQSPPDQPDAARTEMVSEA
ncbi:arthrofactin-type cyclic lipopeptide synthetase C [Actinokineospora alba]|uniref:Arthrofactin-type cyclic lipopeptide synthetase C n=1 Tax=Actinokineospora alba TaxID=504798 RepID=A0A1H0FBQ3_9PSEU|nr:phosphopantetheine-binding protein [Actinokineospora alba]TDP69415.1 phosphopantetheine binding protein [Actinokineospora alba]SDI17251.1 arthrofactin-type cyclic lipopeptide synthetase C [Actinokineospora alba]SDN91991.1 arthrofactin-type cyclic lipopeptide synthetase C [Actinokineospora alba]